MFWSTGSRCAGFSSCGSQAPEHRLSSFGTWAKLLCGMWDPPRPRLEPVSPALAGGISTTVAPGKSPNILNETKLTSLTQQRLCRILVIFIFILKAIFKEELYFR